MQAWHACMVKLSGSGAFIHLFVGVAEKKAWAWVSALHGLGQAFSWPGGRGWATNLKGTCLHVHSKFIILLSSLGGKLSMQLWHGWLWGGKQNFN